MDNSTYTTLTRQSGLLREMQIVANNIANSATTGFRSESTLFAEYVHPIGTGKSLSMAVADGRWTSREQGPLERTGGRFDFAIEGTGLFMVQTPQGEMLTRAGAFTPNEAGELVTPDGHLLLDAGGAPIFVPPDARDVELAADGTLSAGDRPLTRIGLFRPADPMDLQHRSGTLFEAPGGIEPVIDGGKIIQGFVEGSNVDPISQVARMIEVQRSYELGQRFLEREDERIRDVLRTMGR